MKSGPHRLGNEVRTVEILDEDSERQVYDVEAQLPPFHGICPSNLGCTLWAVSQLFGICPDIAFHRQYRRQRNGLNGGGCSKSKGNDYRDNRSDYPLLHHRVGVVFFWRTDPRSLYRTRRD